MKNYVIIGLVFLLLTIFSTQAKATFLPGMLVIQDINSNIIGYISVNGEVMDGDYNLIGYIRENGTIEGANSYSIGYFDSGKFQDKNFNPIGFFRGNRVENTGFYPVGYINNGRIEAIDYKTVGYFTGETGGKDWVIAAFCLYYTDMFSYDRIKKDKIK
jgi:hypothetical protein